MEWSNALPGSMFGFPYAEKELNLFGMVLEFPIFFLEDDFENNFGYIFTCKQLI